MYNLQSKVRCQKKLGGFYKICKCLAFAKKSDFYKFKTRSIHKLREMNCSFCSHLSWLDEHDLTCPVLIQEVRFYQEAEWYGKPEEYENFYPKEKKLMKKFSPISWETLGKMDQKRQRKREQDANKRQISKLRLKRVATME